MSFNKRLIYYLFGLTIGCFITYFIINQKIDLEKFYLSQESIYQKLNKLCKNLDIYYNIRPSGTEPLLRVNLQYEKRNIKVSILNKLKTQIIKVISDAC